MIPLLDRDQVSRAFRDLLVGGVRRQIPNILGEPPAPTAEDAKLLLSVASRLALSDEHQDRHAAYEIVTLIIEAVGESPASTIAAAEMILSRLGNFPARKLTKQRYPHAKDEPRFYPSALALEAIAREVENSFELRNQVIHLTDFQRRLLDSLDRWNSVSFSAPTSAGKSYLLSLDIVRSQLRSPTNTTILVVPTRALIRQVMRDIIEQFRLFGVEDVSVLCVPEALGADDKPAGAVYVLTQERLMAFLNGDIPIPRVSLVIIDEAQEVSDSGRGILLQSSVERILKQCPKAKVLFSSPLRRNPGFLLSPFGRTEQGEFFVEHNSPVSQNVMTLTHVSRQKRRARIALIRDAGSIEVGETTLPFDFRGTKPYLLANFAFHLTHPGDSTIVYANDPTEAESTARTLYDLHTDPENLPPALSELIAFIEQNIHRSYSLAQFLRRRVAFHYGYMPDVIRTAIEDLARDGVVRFVCCTSTLLQGVNLPARNIVICKPTKGRGNTMEAGDFWNLAGRAGRLMKEYRGNVWCISPNEWGADPTKSDKLTEMKAAFPTAVAFQATQILESAQDRERRAENKDTTLADQSFAKVFNEFSMEGRNLSDSNYCNDANRDICIQIDRVCTALTTQIQQPHEIFNKHNGVLPYRIEELGAYIRAHLDIELLIPFHPRRQGSAVRLREIYHVLEVTCFKTGQERYRYFAGLSWRWMLGDSLGDLIENKITYEKIPDQPKRISVAIRDLLNDLDRTIRFLYVKYMRLYSDILIAEIRRRQRLELLTRVVPIHTYLEHGSCDEALLHLMGLGLSRTAAIAMLEALELQRDASFVACRDAFYRVNLDRVDLTPLVRREVEMISTRGRGSAGVPEPASPQG